MYILASNCKITEGFNAALISDLQTQKFYWVSKELGHILINSEYLQTTINTLDSSEYREELTLFLDQEIILNVPNSDIQNFISYPDEFDFPAQIVSAIIDRNIIIDLDIKSLTHQLNSLQCKFVEIRYYTSFSTQDLSAFLMAFDDTTIESIDVYLPFLDFRQSEISRLYYKSGRLTTITVHSVPSHAIMSLDKEPFLIFTQQVIDSQHHCGIISPFYFTNNIPTYTESINHNSCLNKKIGIDVNGNIKNCPSMTKSYGNIRDTSLIEVARNPDFQKVWNITKDHLQTCKDCEFRHICTDCRAYIENPDDLYSKPLKCGYDPYTNTWEEWNKNPLKKITAEKYGITL